MSEVLVMASRVIIKERENLFWERARGHVGGGRV
jgi:hypothetical protein